MPANSFSSARRDLLKTGMLLAVGGKLGLMGIRQTLAKDSDLPLNELDYSQIQFNPGPLERQARENHRLLLNLSEDSLLRPFRQREGLPAPGKDLGGWYDTYAFAPGATFGQWICALSRYYAIWGDAPTRAKVQRLVRGYAATVEPSGKFYRHNRFPAYIYDKLIGGLIDAKRYTHDDIAIATMARTRSAALPYLPPHAMPRNEHAKPGQDFSEHAWDESYTIPENQFIAANLTGDATYTKLARRFLYDDFFGALARGENALPGKHAYSHVNALSSAARAYLSLGQREYLRAAVHGLDFVEQQSFATGGWGPDEHFFKPDSDVLAKSLIDQHKSFETPCGSYAHIKLTRYLLRITRDSHYGDSMERVLYNTVLGAKPIQPDGHAFYYSDYARAAHKNYYWDRWPCCSGTLPMVAADYRISAFFTDAHGIYANLYIPGHVDWKHDGTMCRLSVETDYPYASGVTMHIKLSQPRTFALRLRIPGWAAGASVSINGKRATTPVAPGSFATVLREWRSGDRVELELPLRMRLRAIDDRHPELVALYAGPLVLMRLLDGDEPDTHAVPKSTLLTANPRSGDARSWTAGRDAQQFELRAFADIGAQHYSVYQNVAA